MILVDFGGEIRGTSKLDHPILASFATSTEGKRPTGTIQLDFERITYRYDSLSSDGRAAEGDECTWNLLTNNKG
jgi:type VI protein secretion system component Hcp